MGGMTKWPGVRFDGHLKEPLRNVYGVWSLTVGQP